MTEQPDDAALLARLAATLDGAQEPPEAVAALARLSYGLRDVDGELAELVADSALERTPAGVRAGAATPRLVTFSAADADLEVQVTPRTGSAAGWDVLGQVVPAGPAAVRLEPDRAGGEAVETEADELGRFALVAPTAGPWRLVCRRQGLPHLVSSWLLLD
jgi:hypothetical protein